MILRTIGIYKETKRNDSFTFEVDAARREKRRRGFDDERLRYLVSIDRLRPCDAYMRDREREEEKERNGEKQWGLRGDR